MSSMPCGCDPDYVGEQGYDQGRHGWVCAQHLSPNGLIPKQEARMAVGSGGLLNGTNSISVVPDSFQPAIKDSGKREQFLSGMQRDVTEGKTDYTLIMDGPMFERWAVHLTNGAKKYDKRNWMKANGQTELDRFRESAMRHFMSWMNGITDEDHAAAVIFNINGAEYVRSQKL